MYLKPLPKPQPKTMKFVFGEDEVNLLNQIKEIGLPFTSWVLIGRKDLFKSIKYQGKELLTEPTIEPIDWVIEGETVPSYSKQQSLFEYYLLNEEGWNSDYVLTIQDVLGKELPELNDEILLEVEFKDGLTDLSVMNTFSLGLTEISSNLFEDCTEVTNFEYAFDNTALNEIINTILPIDGYENPLKSPCPIDKDGTPLYERNNSKEGYAIVTNSRGCFFTCNNMSDYNKIPGIYGGKYFDDTYKSDVMFVLGNPYSINEVLEDGTEKEIELPSGKTIVEGLVYGFNTNCGKDASTSIISNEIRYIDYTNYDTSKIKDFSGMFEEASGGTTSNVINFDTSNAENMQAMFSCGSGNVVNINKLDTRNVTNMSYMFSDSISNYLNLNGWNTSSVTNMNGMFSNNRRLYMLDLSTFDISNVTTMNDMFSNCESLQYIKCTQAFKDWCWTNQNTINLPEPMREGGDGTWDIVS